MKYKHQRIRVGEFTTIYKRGKKGVYTADFHHDGEHCRESLKTRNKKIARQRAMRDAAHLEAQAWFAESSSPHAIS